jgi:hypothetical protein
MSVPSGLVGRQAERGRLEDALERARLGMGSIVLVSGEAGVGKTRLAADLAAGSDVLLLRGAPSHGGTAPFGPVIAALRGYLRSNPEGLANCGPLCGQLALLLPELGAPAPAADRPALFEAMRCAFAHIAAERPVLVVLDDLQWSDEATLELLAALAEPLSELSVLVLAAYRSGGLPRDHGVRRLRNDLRRTGQLDELSLRPLDLEATIDLLAQALGEPPSPSLARAIHDRTEGVPFFVEELASALRVSGALQTGRRGLELTGDGDVPLPDTVRDAVLISASELSEEARAAVEVAAVAGETFELELIAALSSDDGVAELLDRGLVREDGSGAAGFRHALTREALYADVPWMRRRTLHRALAEAFETAGAQSRVVATQWLGARAAAPAREALLRAATESEAVHAYRDAADAGRQALELWPESGDEERRSEALERYARCSRGSSPRPHARGGSSARCGAPPATSGRSRTRSGGWPRCTSSRAIARRPSARDGSRRRRTQRPAAPARPPSSTWRWPTSGAVLPSTGRRSSWRPRRARKPTRPAASTSGSAPWASRAWRALSTATTRRASGRCAPASRWRSSTT